MKILVLNSGSSSYKFALYDIEQSILTQPESPIWSSTYEFRSENHDKLSSLNHLEGIRETLKNMPTPLSKIEAVGHRIVHGGSQFQQPTLITSEVKESINHLSSLAPLHNPQNLAGIEITEKLMPNVPQIAVFDTAFHSTLSEAASTYSGPYSWKGLGIKRYGFHGISYQYCSAQCSALLNKKALKIVCCHLGNGASITAIDNHRSVDTTMGLTPLEGLMMGTRCGSIDPSILLFLQKQYHQTPDELFHTLNHASGLQGISGVTNDMREIIKLREEGNSRAILSFDMYIHSLKKNIGAMAAVIDGLDALVFTAGIGENAVAVRQAACQDLKHLGVILDEKRNINCQADAIISTTDSTVKIVVIATKEDWCIAHIIEQMRIHGAV